MLWDNLKPFVLDHPHINFMLFHFSMKHKDSEIIDFFKNQNISNVMPLVFNQHKKEYVSSETQTNTKISFCSKIFNYLKKLI